MLDSRRAREAVLDRDGLNLAPQLSKQVLRLLRQHFHSPLVPAGPSHHLVSGVHRVVFPQDDHALRVSSRSIIRWFEEPMKRNVTL